MQNFTITPNGAEDFIKQLDSWHSKWSEATLDGEVPKANDIVNVGVRMLKSNDIDENQKVVLAEKLMVTLNDYKKTGQKGRKRGVQKVIQTVAGIVHDKKTDKVHKTHLSTVVKAKLYKPQAGQRDKSWFNVVKKWRARKTRKALNVIQGHALRGDVVDGRQEAENLLKTRPAGSIVFFKSEPAKHSEDQSEYAALVKLPGGNTFKVDIPEQRLKSPSDIGATAQKNPKVFLKQIVHIPMFSTSKYLSGPNSSGTYPMLKPGQWGIETESGIDYLAMKHEDGGVTRAEIEPKEIGQDWTMEDLDQAYNNASNQHLQVKREYGELKDQLESMNQQVEVADNQEQAEKLLNEAKAGTTVVVPSHTLQPKKTEGDSGPQGGLAFENYTVLIRLPKAAESTKEAQARAVTVGNAQAIFMQFGQMRQGRLPESAINQMRQVRELTGLGHIVGPSFDAAKQKIDPDAELQKGDYFFVPKEDGVLTMYHLTGQGAEVSGFKNVNLNYHTRPIMEQVQAVLDGEDPESVGAFKEPISKLNVTAEGDKLNIASRIEESGW